MMDNSGMTAKQPDESKPRRGRPPVAPEDYAVAGAIRLTRSQWVKFRALGGARWLRERIDKARKLE